MSRLAYIWLLCLFSLYLIPWNNAICCLFSKLCCDVNIATFAQRNLYVVLFHSRTKTMWKIPWEIVSGWFSKLLTTSTRGECDVCSVAVPWNSTCFPSTFPCIHKYPWQHLVSGRRQTGQHTLWIPKGLGCSCWHPHQSSSTVRKRSQQVAGVTAPLGMKVLHREDGHMDTKLHSDICSVSHRKSTQQKPFRLPTVCRNTALLKVVPTPSLKQCFEVLQSIKGAMWRSISSFGKISPPQKKKIKYTFKYAKNASGFPVIFN